MSESNSGAQVCSIRQRKERDREPDTHSDEGQDNAISIEGWKPLLPEHWYEAKYVGHETALVFNAAKVFLHFEIVEHGEFMGRRVFRAFRVRKLLKPAG